MPVKSNFTQKQARRQRGALPPLFLFLPPPPSDLFLALPLYFFLKSEHRPHS